MIILGVFIMYKLYLSSSGISIHNLSNIGFEWITGVKWYFPILTTSSSFSIQLNL